MVGKLRQDPAWIVCVRALECFADAKVQLGQLQLGGFEPVIHRAAHEFVCEAPSRRQPGEPL